MYALALWDHALGLSLLPRTPPLPPAGLFFAGTPWRCSFKSAASSRADRSSALMWFATSRPLPPSSRMSTSSCARAWATSSLIRHGTTQRLLIIKQQNTYHRCSPLDALLCAKRSTDVKTKATYGAQGVTIRNVATQTYSLGTVSNERQALTST